MVKFRDVIDDFRLADIGFKSARFTWSRGNYAASLVQGRLDRALSNIDWSSMFPLVVLHHLSSTVSDHCPLLLRCCPKFISRSGQQKRFHFESDWAKEPTCVM